MCTPGNTPFILTDRPTNKNHDCWLLNVQRHASESQGRICSDNFTCCHDETEVADQTFYITKSQYADTWSTSPSPDPIASGAWCECVVLGGGGRLAEMGGGGCWWGGGGRRVVTGVPIIKSLGKMFHTESGNETRVCRSRGGRLTHWANEAVKITKLKESVITLQTVCWVHVDFSSHVLLLHWNLQDLSYLRIVKLCLRRL